MGSVRGAHLGIVALADVLSERWTGGGVGRSQGRRPAATPGFGRADAQETDQGMNHSVIDKGDS